MNNYSTATLEMLIKFFNMKASAACRFSNEANQKAVADALDKLDGDLTALREHIKRWCDENPTARDTVPNCLLACMNSVNSKPAPQPIPAAPTDAQVSNSLGILEQALMKVIADTSIPKVEAEIMNGVEMKISDYIARTYGPIQRKITTIIDGDHKEVKGFIHEKFDEAIKFVKNGFPVYLAGPAGCGKNHLCKQIADALGLKFYFTNAVTQEYKLTGFTDANGHYQPTQFYEAFKNGGLFMLDEMDASIPEVLIILNAALANGYFDFPAPIGYVEAHPDFRVIAAGNTTGHGADYQYNGRNQLDAASLDRFALIEMDYSIEIENGIACDIELADFCRNFRKAAAKNGIQTVVSYRAIDRLAKMTQLLDLEEALKTCLTKGLEKDDIKIICNDIEDSKYKTALRKLAA